MIKHVILLILIFSSSAALTSAQAGDAEVRQALSTYDKAWNSKNIKTVGSMLDDRYVYFSSTGSISDKRSTLDFLARPDYKLTFTERTEITIHRSDKTLAIVSSRWKGKGSWSGGEINDDQRCGQVFVKVKGTWNLASEHCVQIVQPAQ